MSSRKCLTASAIILTILVASVAAAHLQPGRERECGRSLACRLRRAVDISLELPTQQIRSGSYITGSLLFRNTGKEDLHWAIGTPLFAKLYDGDSERIAGGYVGLIAGKVTKIDLKAGATQHFPIEVHALTARPPNHEPEALKPGSYRAVGVMRVYEPGSHGSRTFESFELRSVAQTVIVR